MQYKSLQKFSISVYLHCHKLSLDEPFFKQQGSYIDEHQSCDIVVKRSSSLVIGTFD